MLLPDIGEGVAEGEVARWLVREGEFVKKYQPVVELITVKVNVEIPSPHSGKVVKLLAKEGDVVKVGQPLMILETGQEQAAPEAEPLVVPATPSVRRLARELGVDLAKVEATGPRGRITEEDVRRAATHVQPPGPVKVTKIPLRGLRRSIAERLTISKTRAAQATAFETVDASALISLREAMRRKAEEKGVRLTYLPIIVKLVADVLREYPALNGTVDDERAEIVLSQEFNIGIAVDTEQGLLVPVARNVESKDILALAAELETLAEKARGGKLGLDEVRGGTFTITNVGAAGGLIGTPIINYPEIAILAVGRIEKRPAVDGDSVTVKPMMELALTFDHRLVDGAYASRFLLALKKNLENPGQLAV